MKSVVAGLAFYVFAMAGGISTAQVYYSQPRVIHTQPIVVGRATSPTQTVAPSCSCNGAGCDHCHDHQPDRCRYNITGNHQPGKTDCVDVPFVPPTECEVIPGNTVPFYEDESIFDGNVARPVTDGTCMEKFEFEKKTYNVCGCTVNICVPCRVCCTESGGCKSVTKQGQILVRIRRGTNRSVADVWVNATNTPQITITQPTTTIKGLPINGVLITKASKAEIASMFGVDLGTFMN